jgi:ArsR family transcriptional regulator
VSSSRGCRDAPTSPPLPPGDVRVPAAANASVLSTVSNGTLTITGDAADDRITVRPGSSGDVLVNDHRFAGVSRLAINSGAGADEIRIDGLAIPATIESGAGADVIAGGAGPETIVAGDDADLVDGGAGQDTIVLGAGNDTALEPKTKRANGERCREPVVYPEVEREQAQRMAAIANAIADPVRLQLVDVLRRHAGKVCVTELVPLFDLAQPTVSHHLRSLRDAGIMQSEKRGLWVYYYVEDGALDELAAWLHS